MLNKPVISVVMPVYNGKKHLREAIESILKQSFQDFEFIIVNDGSTDDTEELVRSYKDERIVYIKNTSNRGLAVSFNIGIRLARGEHIARMDADDISLPERFQKQLSFLKSHPDVGIVGSAVLLIDEYGHHLGKHSRPSGHLGIKWVSLFSTPLLHPTIMARSEILKENQYDEILGNSEDYELWSRLIFDEKVVFANLSEPLLRYRVFHNSFTQRLKIEKRAISAQNSIDNIERYIALSEQEKELLISLRQEKSLTVPELKIIWRLYKRAADAFCQEEHPSLSTPSIYAKLGSLAVFLAKHKLKSALKPTLGRYF